MLSGPVLPPYSGGKPKSAVILLHGLGDSGAGLIGLGDAWRKGLPETEFIAPDAPFPCEYVPFGFQWFNSQDWTHSVILEGVKKAAPYLDEFIDHVITSRGLMPDRVALAGFSQGTMMALYVAPRRAPALAGVLGYSGALIGGDTLPQERKSAPPVLLVHGMLDDVVSFQCMGQAERGLQNANINVKAIARPGLYHSIDEVGLSEGLRFLRQVLG